MIDVVQCEVSGHGPDITIDKHIQTQSSVNDHSVIS